MAEPTDYDTVAERYAAEIDQRPWNALYERPATLALLPDVRGKDVLDAGCGHGWYCQWLLDRGARVVGVDRSVRMAGLATKRVGSRARIVHGNVSDLRDVLADATFDIVLSSLMLHYVDDLDFQEIGTRLGKKPNAIHQIHYRALAKLRRDAA